MRKGLNPAKQSGTPAYIPERLGMLTVVNIPILTGFYENALKIFKIHAASVRVTTTEPFNYIVFDNGSCAEVKQELHRMEAEGCIDWLVTSAHNLGKTGALNMILPGLPNEWICYSDSDMFFRAGWLEASRKIDAAFPNCGMVSAQIVFPDWDIDRGNTDFRKNHGDEFEISMFKPEPWIVEEYCTARGVAEETARDFREMQLEKVTRKADGIEAVMGGNSHQQWLARREVILKTLPLPSEKQLDRMQTSAQDIRIDEMGYLHLSTMKPYLYHMGNEIDEGLRPEIEALKEAQTQAVVYGQKESSDFLEKTIRRLGRNKGLRRLLMRLYNDLYKGLTN